MRRREFITLLGGAAAWSLAAQAQQGDRVRRIGMLLAGDDSDLLRYSAFTQTLAELGWAVGRNVRIDFRWAGGDINRMRELAQELVGLQPEIILTDTTPGWVALARSAGPKPRQQPCQPADSDPVPLQPAPV